MIAGFGGQGIQFAGKFLITIGMQTGHEVTLIPSYGPEMRGGTSYCTAIISEELISTPVVARPEIIVALNGPSFEKFEERTAPGGMMFIDSTFVKRTSTRDDVQNIYVPATQLAGEHGITALANMIMLGKLIKEIKLCDEAILSSVMEKAVSARRRDLIELNMKALALGAVQ